MEIFLTLISGLAWTIVYIELIRKGFKDKTCAMPLYALGLNIAWELLYTVDGFRLSGISNIQTWVNFVWASFDCIIVYLFFRYGREFFPKKSKRYFIQFGILSFITCFVLQFAFYFEFGSAVGGGAGAAYSAFAQNVAMSILFLSMLFQRETSRGQTITMAVAKWIGTLAPTILMGLIQQFDIYILLTGIVCSVFDIIYIIMLAKMKNRL